MAERNAIISHNQETIDQFLMWEESTHDDISFDMFINDDRVNEPVSDNVVGNSGTDFSGIYLEDNAQNDNWNGENFTQNSAFGNPIQIPIWPVPPSPHSCSCCQTLREISHVNGIHVSKLEIHGRLGIISHAVLEKYSTFQNHEYYMLDFCHESISNVKQFLVQYCEDRKKEGFVMLQDPLSSFYEAMCYGLDGISQMNQEERSNHPDYARNEARLTKSHMASQRERTGKMKLKDLTDYFHLPISAAAKEMNICSTALKSICRKQGLQRWPHRKIKGIKRQISKKKKSLDTNNAQEKARALTEIQELEQRLASIYQA